MIEIVYDKKTAEKHVSGTKPYAVPKNIRQIGNASSGKKIYIEDYVMTFLRRIAEPGNTVSRGAVLLGEYFKDDEGEVIFISGAVEAQNLEFDVEQIRFDDQIWSGIYSEINKYFDNLSVVGWFLSRMGFSVDLNDKIRKLHLEHFKGRDKVLFMMDSLECEDAFYAYEKGQLVRQKGYYIYYVRNEHMQNYIISRKNAATEDKSMDVLRKDQALVANFRDMSSVRKELKSKGRNYFAYAVSSFVMVFALSVGIALSGSYDKMKDIERKIKRIEIEENDSDIEVFYNSNDLEDAQDKTNSDTNNDNNNSDSVLSDKEDKTADTDNRNDSDKINDTDKANDTEEPNNTDEANDNESIDVKDNTDTKEVFGNEKEHTYIVEEGDTLMSISIQMYDSPAYVDEILNANGLSAEDTIYVGQKIVIPYVD